MLSVEAALEFICQSVTPAGPVRTPLNEALGRVIAEPIVSSADSPPFDKSMMDGYAVRAAEVCEGVELSVVDEITAGRISTRAIQAGQAARIMTGAPIPAGADGVVRVEETTSLDGGTRVRLNLSGCRSGRDIVPRGQSMRAGDTVIAAGRIVRIPEVALLAELGHAVLEVRPQPTVAIIATGDELVPIDAVPGPAQIRNTNEPMLAAQVQMAGAIPCPLGVARDESNVLEALIRKGLEADVLCLSGGVSAGKLDLVPAALKSCEVEQGFHKLAMKPGKPLWFGYRPGDPATSRKPCWIFGLPGNPVSSMVCFDLFVRTALRRLQGIEPATPRSIPARLGTNFAFRDERPTWLPVRVEWTSQGPVVSPVGWRGSSDLRATVDADGTAHFPAGERNYVVGDEVQFYPWSGVVTC